MSRGGLVTGLLLVGLAMGTSAAADPDAVERGKHALLGRAFTPATWSPQAYQNAWKQWGLKEAPVDYAKAFQERYGLHPTPYPNHDYPMGLREGRKLFGGTGLSTDCLLCHGGSIFGQSYVGLGNASLDIQAFFDELNAADGWPAKTPFTFSTVRGTSEAGGMAVYLLGGRKPDLSGRPTRLDLGLRDDLCEDPPAWWLLKKKKTMYHTGGGDARSVRSLMQFMMSPLNLPEVFEREEATFRDIQAYLLSIPAPKYPLPIDRPLAAQGDKLFVQNCARCHGTYGPNGTYPNKIIPLDVIGTDRTRYHGLSKEFGEYYNQSWFAQEKKGWLVDDYKGLPSAGYQAPPLDGIWATAPYFHNGSVPTVYHVLNSKARPKIYTRSFRTDRDAYDPVKLGWRVQVLERGPAATVPDYERRKVYDTTQTGRGNDGHPFGDHLSETQRMAVIEYLKTL
jgi:mono/diheme cytochrome c family protein